MLKHLTIKNYALIRHLEFSPEEGLNVITGETGAGKSIILGALGLLLGNRADSRVLLDEKEKCITEGVFKIGAYQLEKSFQNFELDYSPETILRREINPNGKSRAFINDTPVTLEVMRKIGYLLMDIHSQHETLELGEQLFQLKFVDAYAGNEKIRQDYQQIWSVYCETQLNLKNLENEAGKLRQEADYIRFQFQEIDQLNLEEGEQEILESKIKVGENAELIRSKLLQATELLSDGEYSIKKVVSEIKLQISQISSFDPAFHQILERIEGIKSEIDDLGSETNSRAERINVNAEEMAEAQERLDQIYTLQRKHRVTTVAELLSLCRKFSNELYKTDHLDEEIQSLYIKVEKLQKEVLKKAEELSLTRTKVLKKISTQAKGLLIDLGIPDTEFLIHHTTVEAGSMGIDQVSICFSANRGIEAKPIAETASGGEFSRLMFVLKFIMAERTSMPTLLLDEIDTGISGDIAIKLGRMMKKMALNHQVISISHLAQIAAAAAAHYVVYKDTDGKRAASQIKLLEPQMRMEELARIISGNSPSTSAKQYAKELLEQFSN